jgi:hypothetical protein
MQADQDVERASRRMMRCIEDDGSKHISNPLRRSKFLDQMFIFVHHIRRSTAALRESRSVTKADSGYLPLIMGRNRRPAQASTRAIWREYRDHTFTITLLQGRRAVPDR